MSYEEVCKNLGDELGDDDYHTRRFGEYHPSHIAGCPLGCFLDFMLEEETEYNNYMFSGTAVHYYLQESGKLTSALQKSGYNQMFTEYEVMNSIHVGKGARILGRCDALVNSPDKSAVIDLKYSSIKPSYNNSRLAKYAVQANTYAHMFGVDEWCLLMIHSKADHIPDEIDFLADEKSEDAWEVVKDKARNIHEALREAGYDDGERWTEERLKSQGREFWENVMEHFDESRVPSYDTELKWSDRDEWVMPYMDDWKEEQSTGGLSSFKGGT